MNPNLLMELERDIVTEENARLALQNGEFIPAQFELFLQQRLDQDLILQEHMTSIQKNLMNMLGEIYPNQLQNIYSYFSLGFNYKQDNQTIRIFSQRFLKFFEPVYHRTRTQKYAAKIHHLLLKMQILEPEDLRPYLTMLQVSQPNSDNMNTALSILQKMILYNDRLTSSAFIQMAEKERSLDVLLNLIRTNLENMPFVADLTYLSTIHLFNFGKAVKQNESFRLEMKSSSKQYIILKFLQFVDLLCSIIENTSQDSDLLNEIIRYFGQLESSLPLVSGNLIQMYKSNINLLYWQINETPLQKSISKNLYNSKILEIFYKEHKESEQNVFNSERSDIISMILGSIPVEQFCQKIVPMIGLSFKMAIIDLERNSIDAQRQINSPCKLLLKYFHLHSHQDISMLYWRILVISPIYIDLIFLLDKICSAVCFERYFMSAEERSKKRENQSLFWLTVLVFQIILGCPLTTQQFKRDSETLQASILAVRQLQKDEWTTQLVQSLFTQVKQRVKPQNAQIY